MLDISPVIFLKLAQDNVGESDFVFIKAPSYNISDSADVYMHSNEAFKENRKPHPIFTLPFVNATQLEEVIYFKYAKAMLSLIYCSYVILNYKSSINC